MFKVIETVVSSAVVATGTFNVTYPTGVTAGSFAGAHAHKMWVDTHQNMYSAPNDFTVSFGATYATVTYNGSTTIAAGSRVNCQFEMLSANGNEPWRSVIGNSSVERVQTALLDLGAPATADTNGVAESQSVAEAAAFDLDGVLVQNGVAYFDTPRNVVAGWTGTAVLTITGTDVDGNTLVEKTASGTSHTGSKAFKTVTSVTSSAAITSATVGTGTKIGLPAYVPDASYILAELKNGVALPRRPGVVYLTGRMLAAAIDAGTSYEVTSPVAGVIRKLTITGEGSTTTGGNFTVEVNTVAVDGLTVTVANSAAAGEVDTGTATLGHASTAVAVGDRIEIIPAAAFNSAADMAFMLEIDTSAAGQLTGTFVAGVTSKATATTGDVRGTYTPLTPPDGTNGYKLLVALPDPSNAGVPQYTG